MNTKIQETDSEEFFRHLFNSAGEGMVVVNHLGQIVTANARTKILFGFETEELIGQTVGILIPKNVRPHHQTYVSEYFKKPKVRMMSESPNLFGQKKDGSTFPIEISLTYFKTSEDLFSIALISDVTQRKEDEKKIHELNEQLELKVKERTAQLGQSEKLYSTIAENFPDGSINVLDNELNYVFCEGRELKKQGIQAKKILGTSYLDRFSTKDAERIRRHFHSVFQGTPASFDFELNSAFYDADAVPLENIHGEIQQVLVFEKNVTRKKIAEVEIKNSLEKERELNVLKSRFVSMASHEFRTPLAAILSSVSLIGKYTKEDQQENRNKHIVRIKSSIHNLTTILNDFLSLDKLETGKVTCNFELFDIQEKCNQCIEDVQNLLKKDQSLTYLHSGHNEPIKLDPQLTRNIMVNLLSNAVKYSFEGQSIQIRTLLEENNLTIEVEDQGMGIPIQEQEHLFQRFYRAKNATNIQGTGLGLNIVRKHVDLMGGSITYKSAENEGTIFKITLPAQKKSNG